MELAEFLVFILVRLCGHVSNSVYFCVSEIMFVNQVEVLMDVGDMKKESTHNAFRWNLGIGESRLTVGTLADQEKTGPDF